MAIRYYAIIVIAIIFITPLLAISLAIDCFFISSPQLSP
jgi:hypothetical protein